MEDLYLVQKRFTEANSLPMFASRQCYHSRYSVPTRRNPSGGNAVIPDKSVGLPVKLHDMLIYKYGSYEKAYEFASTDLITGCPLCPTSWCD